MLEQNYRSTQVILTVANALSAALRYGARNLWTANQPGVSVILRVCDDPRSEAAFIVAEATLSYVGLGFPDSVPTWGTMLYNASNVALVGEAPWMLAPAAAIFLVVLAVNLVVQGSGRSPVQLEP